MRPCLDADARSIASATTRLLLAGGAAALALGLGGCGTSSSGSTAAGPGGNGGGALVPTDLDRVYIVGPSVAREIGYRIDWQHPGTAGRPAEHLLVADDSLFTLDGRNVLSRHLLDSGDRLWSDPVERDTVEFLGMNWVPDEARVYLTSGSTLYGIDATGGGLVKQDLQRVANTQPLRFGQFLVYGGRQGELVWHSYRIGAYWRGYQIAPTVQVPPVISDGVVVVVGADGRVMAISATTTQQIWSYRALEPIVAPPAVHDGTVFVSSLDQHVRAFDLFSDRGPLWQHLVDRELRDAPVALDDRVYQNVPGRGLLCLEARPLDQPGGVVVWQADGTGGSVITRSNGRLFLWDGEARRLEVVDPRLGALVDAYDLPQVRELRATSLDEGDLIGTGDDGRIIRLVPRVRSAA